MHIAVFNYKSKNGKIYKKYFNHDIYLEEEARI